MDLFLCEAITGTSQVSVLGHSPIPYQGDSKNKQPYGRKGNGEDSSRGSYLIKGGKFSRESQDAFGTENESKRQTEIGVGRSRQTSVVEMRLAEMRQNI